MTGKVGLVTEEIGFIEVADDVFVFSPSQYPKIKKGMRVEFTPTLLFNMAYDIFRIPFNFSDFLRRWIRCLFIRRASSL